MKTTYLLPLLLVCVCLLPAGRASAQGDIFLKINGLEGSSTVAGYENQIELLALSYGGASNPGGGPAQVSPIVMTMEMDPKAYPKLLQKVFTTATITAAGTFKITGRITFPGANAGVKLVSYEIEVIEGEYDAINHDGSAGDRSHVFLSIRPTQLRITTKKYDASGNSAGSEVFTWNVNP